MLFDSLVTTSTSAPCALAASATAANSNLETKRPANGAADQTAFCTRGRSTARFLFSPTSCSSNLSADRLNSGKYAIIATSTNDCANEHKQMARIGGEKSSLVKGALIATLDECDRVWPLMLPLARGLVPSASIIGVGGCAPSAPIGSQKARKTTPIAPEIKARDSPRALAAPSNRMQTTRAASRIKSQLCRAPPSHTSKRRGQLDCPS